jgi:hypothetical protein
MTTLVWRLTPVTKLWDKNGELHVQELIHKRNLHPQQKNSCLEVKKKERFIRNEIDKKQGPRNFRFVRR